MPSDLDGQRLDRAVAHLAGISRSRARQIVDDGGVTRDETALSARTRVTTGEEISFEVPPAAPLIVAHQVDYDLIHSDEDILVIGKPAGLTVHPGAGTDAETLAAGLLYDFPELEGVGVDGRWGIVHRLDRPTSGLLVVARSQRAHERLSAMMRAREVTRRYLALTQGVMDIPRGTVDAPIGADPNRATKRALSPTGKRAVTHYRRTNAWRTSDVSSLEVTLETGRTHQIRVHLAAIGHPVLGDRLYGGGDPIKVPRLCLHAAELEFHHPISDQPMRFEAPLPEDLDAAISELGDPD